MTSLSVLAASGTLVQNAEAAHTVPVLGENYVMETKWDGWRMIAHVTDGGVELYSRSGKRYDKQLPQISAELSKLPNDTWLDGEAVAITFEGDQVRNDWSVVQSALSKHGGSALEGKVTYVVFDLLAHGGIDARPLSYGQRRSFLERAVKPSKHVQIGIAVDATQANHDKIVTMGFEGSVIKNVNRPYASGKRGQGWTKIKAVATEDVVVMGFEQGKDVGGIIFGSYKDGVLVQRGTCKRKPIVPADNSQIGTVIEVAFNAITKDGALRHPRLLRRREDKAAKECVWA